MAAPQELIDSATKIVDALASFDNAVAEYITIDNDLRNRGLLTEALDKTIFGIPENLSRAVESARADLQKLSDALSQ